MTTSIITNSLVFVIISFITNRVNVVANLFPRHPAGEKKTNRQDIGDGKMVVVNIKFFCSIGDDHKM
jgi:hypothetical protein